MWVDEWLTRWREHITPAAAADLRMSFGLAARVVPGPREMGKSEAFTSSLIMLEAAEKDVRLFRNNVGAYEDDRGAWVRYGLANTSSRENELLKSSDFIGWRPVRIEAWMVGATIGQFVGREAKKPGWSWTGTPREIAQANWATLGLADGCDMGFATGRGTL